MIKSANNYLGPIRKSFKRFATAVFLRAQVPRLFSLGRDAARRPVSLPVSLVSFPGQRPLSPLGHGLPRFRAGPVPRHGRWRWRRRRLPPPCAPRVAGRRPISVSDADRAGRRAVRRYPSLATACPMMSQWNSLRIVRCRWKPCASPCSLLCRAPRPPARDGTTLLGPFLFIVQESLEHVGKQFNENYKNS